ncbi:MAG: PLP-dependent transferase [Candidatus Malihini olakiniferum]
MQRASSLIFETVADKKQATSTEPKVGCSTDDAPQLMTHFSLQEAMTELEGGVGYALYPCGAAAISNTILSFVSSGDHVLVTGSIYELTQAFCDNVLSKFNVATTYFDALIGAPVLPI